MNRILSKEFVPYSHLSGLYQLVPEQKYLRYPGIPVQEKVEGYFSQHLAILLLTIAFWFPAALHSLA